MIIKQYEYYLSWEYSTNLVGIKSPIELGIFEEIAIIRNKA